MSRDILKRTLAVVIVLIGIICMIIGQSVGLTISDDMTVLDLINATRDDDWYEFDPSEAVGKKIGARASNDLAGGYCIDPESRLLPKGNRYEIVNTFDINNNSNTVVVYSIENPSGTEYSLSDERVKPLLMVAYLTMKADENPGYHPDHSYKNVLNRIFNNRTWVNKLREIGLSASFQTEMYNDSYLSAPQVQAKLAEAERYADRIQQQGGIEAAVLEVAMTQEEKDDVSIIIDNNKTFIGPYKLSKSSSCTVGEITVNGNIRATGISKDLSTVESVENVADEIPFYIVLDGEVDTEISSINVKSNEAVATLRSRLVLVGNSPSQNFLIWRSEETTTQPEIPLPVPTFGKLQILKEDELKDPNLKLDNIGFVVWSMNKKAYVIQNSNNKIEYVDFATAKENEFKTDTTGVTKVINNLPVGRYKIYETSIPEDLSIYYELPEIEIEEIGGQTRVTTRAKPVVIVDDNGKEHEYVEVKSGQLAPVVAVNKRDFTTLVLEKIDADTPQLPVEGLGFKLYSLIEGKEGWVIVDDNNEVIGTSEVFREGSQFVTEANGLAKLNKVPVGDYAVYETYLGRYEGIYEDLKPIRMNGANIGELGLFKGIAKVTANEKNEFTFTATNKQIYINISGIVWEEVPIFDQNKNKNEINNTFDDKTDNKINGIEVKLIDKTTNEVVQTTTTADGGKYRFEKVEFQKLQEDGETYKNILGNYIIEFTYDGVTYQSVVTPENVTDTTKTSKATETERQEFNDIFTEITGEGQELNGVKLSYTKEDGKVYSNNISDRRNALDQENNIVNLTKNGDFTIDATTPDGYLSTAYNKLKNSSDEMVTEITDVNLGLYIRSQSIISVEKDVHSAKLSVNGFNHIYTYGVKSAEYEEKRAEDFNVGVSWKKNIILEGFDPYTTPVYRSDYQYESDDTSKELQVSIIYKIKLINDSSDSSLTTRINSLVDYFDSRYTNMEVGTGLDESTGTIRENLDYEMDTATTSTGKYKKAIISTNMDIGKGLEGNSKELYVKFDLSKAQVGQLLENGEVLDNVVELNSYTIKQGENLYASFDEYSIPANANPLEPEEFENDTDAAPGLKLDPQDDRTMSGVVFEDNAISEGAGSERIGNGSYDEGENVIPGVSVKLVETDAEGNIKEDGKTYDAEETSNEGIFTVKGYIPGYYKLIYTWGEDDEDGYNVKDYKGTIYIPRDTSKMDWYKQDNRYSDAKDDYELRIAIDNNDTSVYSDLSKMNSSTEVFGIGIEYSGEEPGENITTITTGDSFVRCDVSTMDFGIIARPRQSMSIDKHVKALKVRLGNETELVNAIVNENGEIEGQVDENVKSLTGSYGLGYFKVEMDNELIQDSTADVEYAITVTNTSEIDYDSEAYYLYGIKEGNIITIQATKVYDYLNGSNSEGNKNNEIWDMVSTDRTQTMELDKVKDKTVLEYVKNILTQELEPGASVSESIYATQPLANKEDISLENDTEIVNIVKGGTPFDETTGEATGTSTKFKTGMEPKAEYSKLFATAERVTVTQPTGGNRDYTTVIIISVAAIVILGTGVILIKKKVLDK